MIAVEQLIRAPPDGYTLMINTSEATMLPFLKKSYRYDPIKDFTPIALVVTSWTVFAVNPKVPANTLPELIAYSKSHPAACATARAAPAACCTSRSRCSSSRAAAISCTCPIAAARRPRPTRSPARSRWCRWGSPRRASPNGQLRILAQTGPSRHPMLPDVPTTAEAGLPDVRMDTWFGLVGPPNMPKEIVGAHQPRAGGGREAAGVPGQARQARACGGLQAGRRVHLVHGRGHQEMAGADSRHGHPAGRLGCSFEKRATQMASKANRQKDRQRR